MLGDFNKSVECLERHPIRSREEPLAGPHGTPRFHKSTNENHCHTCFSDYCDVYSPNQQQNIDRKTNLIKKQNYTKHHNIQKKVIDIRR